MYLITSTSTFHHKKYLSTSTFLFGEMYITSSFKMYLGTIMSTFQLPSNLLYTENKAKLLT